MRLGWLASANLAWLALFACLGGCSTVGPGLTRSEPLAATEDFSCSGDPHDPIHPLDHILAIDRRGSYRPATVRCQNGRILTQVRPDHLPEEGCTPATITDPLIGDYQIRAYFALQCQIQHIIDALADSNGGPPQHLVIFIHGGLVDQQSSLDRALQDIPRMISDQEALAKIPDPQGGGKALMHGSRIFPLFLNWPSGPFDTYGDGLADYEQGIYDGPERHLEAPLYLSNDLAEVGARAPLDLVKSVHRLLGSEHALPEVNLGCDMAHFGCNDTGPFQRDPLEGTIYLATTPLRVLTVPALDVGTRAWKNMIARTRFGVERYVDPGQYQAILQALRAPHDAAKDQSLNNQREILTKGAFYLFFDALKRRFYHSESGCNGDAPRITLIGHSMGTMVSNELLREFPRLPYENIVFMAAATSIRDFKAMTEPVLRRPPCFDLRFYNLTLHQDWDAREIEEKGAVPMGSLLEWIDDIFETPVTPIDRTLGKWENIVFAANDFDEEAMKRMFFHRFGLGRPDPLMHGEFARQLGPYHGYPYQGCESLPYWRPQFWARIRNRADDGCHEGTTLIDIDPKALPRAVPLPQLEPAQNPSR